MKEWLAKHWRKEALAAGAVLGVVCPFVGHWLVPCVVVEKLVTFAAGHL